MNAHEIERLAEAVVRRVTVEIEASGRHVHLSRAGVDQLFGVGYRLNRVKDLSQPGQFVCAERVSLVGPKGELKNVVVLGPERGECQAEVSLTDAVALGCKPPVRLSGEIEGTPGITLRHGNRELRLERGLIVAKRHIHMDPGGCRTVRRAQWPERPPESAHRPSSHLWRGGGTGQRKILHRGPPGLR